MATVSSLLLVFFSCEYGSDDAKQSATAEFEYREPYAENDQLRKPCEPRDVSGINPIPGIATSVAYDIELEIPTIEELLEKGLHVAEASPVHLAYRGTPQAGSIRCERKGIARTLAQREEAIRFWLAIDNDLPIPAPAEAERRFMTYINSMVPSVKDTMKASYVALARGGFSNDYWFITCYLNYAATEYLLGNGPGTLTVAYDTRQDVWSYDLYGRAHTSGWFNNDPLMSEGEYEAHLDELVRSAEASLGEQIGGRESVVFLAPMGAHNAIAVEAWQAVEQWDLQTDENEVVHAVRYGVPEGDPEYTQTLVNLTSRITAAATTDDFADDRIENANGLTQYYRDIGAYGDITPGDGSTATFTPAQPPPAYTCANGTAVTSPSVNRGLVHDCEALLEGKGHPPGHSHVGLGSDQRRHGLGGY